MHIVDCKDLLELFKVDESLRNADAFVVLVPFKMAQANGAPLDLLKNLDALGEDAHDSTFIFLTQDLSISSSALESILLCGNEVGTAQ